MYVCSWLSQELSENPTQLPNMLIHLFITLCLDSMLQSLTLNWPPWSLTPNWPLQSLSLLTDWPSALDWLTSFFWCCKFSQAQLFVWSSHQNRPRKVFWTLQHHFKDAGDKFPSLGTYLQAHTETLICIFIFH